MAIQANTRKNGRHLRVPVLAEEEALIKQNAAAARMKVAPFLRNLGMGYEVHSVLDHARVAELAKINGDLGRLGGLLKLWLSNDPLTANFSKATLRALLGKIEDTQGELRAVMKTVVSG